MIYIVKHKVYSNPIPSGYEELFVGYMFKGKRDNINDLNLYLNEVTAMYDLWKNCNDDIIGLCHYRRFFYHANHILTYKEAERVLQNYDIIIAPIYDAYTGLYNQLRNDLDCDEERIVLDKYRDELFKICPEIKNYFSTKRLVQRNMFIAKKELMDEYFKWIMPIAIHLANKFIKEDADKIHQQRLIGYIVERLFGYWIFKNNLNFITIGFKEI